MSDDEEMRFILERATKINEKRAKEIFRLNARIEYLEQACDEYELELFELKKENP